MTFSALATEREIPCKLNRRRPNSSWLKARDLQIIMSIFQPVLKSMTLNMDSRSNASSASSTSHSVRRWVALDERLQLLWSGCGHEVHVLRGAQEAVIGAGSKPTGVSVPHEPDRIVLKGKG
jgi:hypothetical protein